MQLLQLLACWHALQTTGELLKSRLFSSKLEDCCVVRTSGSSRRKFMGQSPVKNCKESVILFDAPAISRATRDNT